MLHLLRRTLAVANAFLARVGEASCLARARATLERELDRPTPRS